MANAEDLKYWMNKFIVDEEDLTVTVIVNAIENKTKDVEDFIELATRMKH
jgi:hypothetical protein